MEDDSLFLHFNSRHKNRSIFHHENHIEKEMFWRYAHTHSHANKFSLSFFHNQTCTLSHTLFLSLFRLSKVLISKGFPQGEKQRLQFSTLCSALYLYLTQAYTHFLSQTHPSSNSLFLSLSLKSFC